MSTTRTAIASHRGGAILWPENSPTAFRATAALAVEQVEFDLHLSADDVPVVIHDPLLDRTTEAKGPVRARSLAELRRVRLKGAAGETVPSLAEVAELFRPTPISLRIELKADGAGQPYPGLLGRAMQVLDAAGMAGRCVFTSFQAPLVAEAAAHAPTIWLLAPAMQQAAGLAGAIAAARALGIGGIGLRVESCDAESVAAIRGAGLSAGAWAVNAAEEIARIFALGVDVFTTDDPVTALRLRG
ncbi:glycerophosphodiester phosphodiesterase [Siccirubricoccus sp. KC 17139]|uniref:Glycerophosphodiester phosphodiesterase n=1 Tax=Siccirubricoccus soli TaxID=2899147 RepID=A0ABT1D964_9PROT|nr:glycerophosphodiester phosphodiesterase family protein [Siccirubricoccus soli]MCO6418481.1 glycerophosphodiester phosphodiesterase [Siccirubricoccus soli]MCP2684616.1 glycerophosphodiester phosphodiesterase [Siccirubricoccus soli]